ncbi:MAG: hypothetical protein D5R96_06475 [Methanocalculus sp. MSAO_Arc2]|nr:MAG: hypothetical protein D5R96_06475 [Methanocalculus sp. MSAO_Arc2]
MNRTLSEGLSLSYHLSISRLMPVHDIETVLKAEEQAVSMIRNAEAEAERRITAAKEKASEIIAEEKKKASEAAEEEIESVVQDARSAAETLSEETDREVGRIRQSAVSGKEAAVTLILRAITGEEHVLSGRDA